MNLEPTYITIRQETLTIRQWAGRLGLSKAQLVYRLKKHGIVKVVSDWEKKNRKRFV